MSSLFRLAVSGFCAAFAAGVCAKTPEQIFQQASKSVVTIHAYDKDGNALNQGGGVVVGKEAVATNCHVVEDSARIAVHHETHVYEAKLTHADNDRDLCQVAVSQLDAPRATLWTGQLRVGQRVYAIGAPEGLELTFTDGLISSLREFEGSQYIQTSAAISSGSSGGGLFDSEGRLIGITSFFLQDGQNLNFALPVIWISKLGGHAVVSGTQPAAAKEETGKRWSTRIAEYKAKKDWAGALTLAQQWVRSQPGYAGAWQELGDAYRNINRPRRAVAPYLQAVRIDPDSFESWLYLGISYLSLNQYDRALETFQEALRLRPNDPTGMFNTGIAYYYQNRQDKVMEVHATLAKIDPKAAQEFARRYVKR
ncbi:MAG: trypsin-like peptidase domain-containing protein [Betaproteobacteria bacterium]|nr:trypsin-like peptidase domain-containing protein [Betaproteobacteria bacterium]